jgi:hypothetical protein
VRKIKPMPPSPFQEVKNVTKNINNKKIKITEINK